MNRLLRQGWPVLLSFLGIAVILGLTLRPYGGNITALFHLDERMNKDHPVPVGFVVLGIPGYDGAQYYQVARNLPALIDSTQWQALRSVQPLSYAYQRILLPVVAYILSLGQEVALPYAFLLINIISLLLSCWIVLKATGRWLPALAYVFCPSAMVALHFTLAEPLALLLFALFFSRYRKNQRIEWIDVALLSLLVLSREVNILFAGFVILYSLYRKDFKGAVLALIPCAIFVAWHSYIYLVFGDIPFLISAGARNIPGLAALKVTLGMRGYDQYTLSAVALFLGFVLPGFCWSLWRIIRGERSLPTIGLAIFLLLMLMLADYIWGSITSIGRVVTPIYPLAIFAYAQSNSRITQLLTLGILLIGLGAGLGLALIAHPFFIR